MNLVKYDTACRALAEARSVDEVKDIKDKSEALRAYARQARNPQLEADAWEIKKRAEDRLGALSAALDKSERSRTDLRPSGGKQTKKDALQSAGISTSAANRYEQFHQLPKAEKETRIAKGRAAIEAGKSIADAVIIQQGDKKDRRSGRELTFLDLAKKEPRQRALTRLHDTTGKMEPHRWLKIENGSGSALARPLQGSLPQRRPPDVVPLTQGHEAPMGAQAPWGR